MESQYNHIKWYAFAIPDGSFIKFKGRTYAAKDTPNAANYEFQATPSGYSYNPVTGNYSALENSLVSLTNIFNADGYFNTIDHYEDLNAQGYYNEIGWGIMAVSVGDAYALGVVEWSNNFTLVERYEPASSAYIGSINPPGPYSLNQQIEIGIQYLYNNAPDATPDVVSFQWKLNGVNVPTNNPDVTQFIFRKVFDTYGNHLAEFTVTFADGSVSTDSIPVVLQEPATPPGTCSLPPALLAATFKAMDFSQNPIVLTIPSVYAPDPASLRYKTDVFVPEFVGSSTFITEQLMESAGPPPVVVNGQYFYSGPPIYLEDVLHAYLEKEVPAFGQNTISINRKGVMPYYNKYFVDPVTTDTPTQTEQKWVFMGGISYEDFPGHLFFTSFLEQKRMFLTWQSTSKVIEKDQPEFLYFLLNFEPVPTTVKLKGNVTYADSSCEQLTLLTKSGLQLYDVLCIPAGHNALGLDQKPKAVKAYTLWLENENNQRLSEIRSYTLETRYRRHKYFFLFQNSLGRYDTLRAYGAGKSILSVDQNTAARFTPFNYQPSHGESYVTNIDGEDGLEVSTGYFTDPSQLEYLQELLFSEDIYLVTDRHFIPLTLLTKNLAYKQDDEYLYYTTIKCRKNYNKRKFSKVHDRSSY